MVSRGKEWRMCYSSCQWTCAVKNEVTWCLWMNKSCDLEVIESKLNIFSSFSGYFFFMLDGTCIKDSLVICIRGVERRSPRKLPVIDTQGTKDCFWRKATMVYQIMVRISTLH